MCTCSEINFTVYPHLVQYNEKCLTASQSSYSPKLGLPCQEEQGGAVRLYFQDLTPPKCGVLLAQGLLGGGQELLLTYFPKSHLWPCSMGWRGGSSPCQVVEGSLQMLEGA